MREKLTELLAKVEGAAEGSRDIDGVIKAAFEPPMDCWGEPADLFVCYDSTDLGVFKTYVATPASYSRRVPEYTASVDEALALVAKLMPGHGAGFQPGIGGRAHGYIVAITDVSAHFVQMTSAPTAPLAILGSLFLALLAQTETSDAR